MKQLAEFTSFGCTNSVLPLEWFMDATLLEIELRLDFLVKVTCDQVRVNTGKPETCD